MTEAQLRWTNRAIFCPVHSRSGPEVQDVSRDDEMLRHAKATPGSVRTMLDSHFPLCVCFPKTMPNGSVSKPGNNRRIQTTNGQNLHVFRVGLRRHGVVPTSSASISSTDLHLDLTGIFPEFLRDALELSHFHPAVLATSQLLLGRFREGSELSQVATDLSSGVPPSQPSSVRVTLLSRTPGPNSLRGGRGGRSWSRSLTSSG
jgi:hypothetical protein